MSPRWNRGKVFPIGIDLGSHSLKMAQLKLDDGQHELVAAGSAVVPGEARKDPAARSAFACEAIRQLMHQYPFKGRQCILALPAEATFVQHIKMAKMPEEQLVCALQWELQGKLPYDPCRAIIQHVVAGEIYADDEIKEEIIVIAASRDVVEAHVDMARRAKLECTTINVEPCAIIECFARLFQRKEDASRATLFVDIGASTTKAVIGHGAHLAFAKNLLVGAAQFDRAVADGMQISLEDARAARMEAQGESSAGNPREEVYRLLGPALDGLAEELTNCLRYYESAFHNRPVERVLFLGGQAHDKRLCQSLAQRMALPAQIGDPLARVKRCETVGQDSNLDHRSVQPDWAVAVGLSLGGAQSRVAEHVA